MKTSVTLILLVATGVAICAKYATTQNERPKDTAQQEVRLAQDALINAYIHKNIDALDHILGDEYTFVADDGSVMDKASTIASFKSGDRQVTSYVRDDEWIRTYGDTAVMTYHYTSKETYRGRDDSANDRLIRIFVKRDGQWQIVAGQETRLSRQQSK